MKVYISHSTSFDFLNEFYLPIKNCKDFEDVQFFFPHDDKEKNTKDIIGSFDLVVAEVSFASTGQGIEIGWADMKNIPLLCLYRKGSKISSSLKLITKNVVEYSDEQDMLKKLKLFLIEQKNKKKGAKMPRKEFVNEVFRKLEETHIYLYHDISKEEFERQKNEFLEGEEELDELHFQAGMLKLFALFKDAHLFYEGLSLNFVNAQIAQREREFYVVDGEKIFKIEKVNGHDIEEVIEKAKAYIPYEVETWAYRQIGVRFLNSPRALAMLDFGEENADKVVYSCEGGRLIERGFPTEEEVKNFKRKPLYESDKFCDGQVLYIRYRACRNMENYPFKQFVEEVAQSCESLPKACLVDVRNNTGGSDVVIRPLCDYLKENNIKTYMLMNEATFSSGTFALASFKEQLNATLLGTDAGQPTRAYGNIKWLEVDGKRFTTCERYFELTSAHDENAPVKPYCIIKGFDYAGVIKPDIEIKLDLQDFYNKVDTQLNESLKIIENDIGSKKR